MFRKFCFFFLLPLASLQTAYASSISLTGTFLRDDSVQLFNVTLNTSSTVTFRTYSYGGGMNAAGVRVVRGGFDPILSLFSSTGVLLRSNDDGTCAQVRMDSSSGHCGDSFLRPSLSAGTYTLALTQFYNEAIGPNLLNGFEQQGTGNFTASAFGPVGATGGFYDFYSGEQRTSNWAVDVEDVDSAVALNAVPEPATVSVTALGLALAGFILRRRK